MFLVPPLSQPLRANGGHSRLMAAHPQVIGFRAQDGWRPISLPNLLSATERTMTPSCNPTSSSCNPLFSFHEPVDKHHATQRRVGRGILQTRREGAHVST